jgi:hypothetical protein
LILIHWEDPVRSLADAPRAILLPAALVLALAGTTALGVRSLGPGPLRLEIGAFDRPWLRGDWRRAERTEVGAEAAAGGPSTFYYRAPPPRGEVVLPLRTGPGPLRITVRATSRLRAGLAVFHGPERLGEAVLGPGRWDGAPGPWERLVFQASVRPGPVELGLVVRPLPLVRREQVADPEVLLDSLELESGGGITLLPRGCLLAALVPLLCGLGAAWSRAGRAWAVLASGLGALATILVVRAAPVQGIFALERLGPVALVGGLVALVLVRLPGLPPVAFQDRARLAWLVAAGVLFHGSVVFFPNHNPPDIDIHVRRTLDLATVPLEYGALLRYGSQLPTASQDLGAATAALGESTLIPYSPLPYVFYYALHRCGLDLYWALTVFGAAAAMLVAPLLWLAAAHVWDREAAWRAALLYTLDLAVWHHLGRSHAPAVFGAALGTAALLHLLVHAERLDHPRRVALAAGVLAVAALGYSSLVVLLGLFGVALLTTLVLDARGLLPPARRGLAMALFGGGLLAGVLYYFHYVPGLLGGAAAVEGEPDLFPGRTFFIFHNESRQSLRLWVLGFWIPLAAGLLAAPVALRRARPAARPVLLCWLLAWAMLMVLKEPGLYPKLLRWAKEDQFVSPLLCLMVAGALGAVPAGWWRRLATAAVLAVALWLQLRDFSHHAVSLRL